MSVKSICVFCGSSFGNNKLYREKTETLGRLLAAKGINLVYGGGAVGLMGVLAEAVMNNSGTVTGVIPELISGKVEHINLTRNIVTKDMHERKKTMYELADGFIALPGGIGTVEELSEVYTWQQLGYHNKPVSLYNINGFFDGFTGFLDHAVNEGFIKQVHRNRLIISDEPENLFYQLDNYSGETIDKWS